jgi:predicted nucleotidyltransferase
LVVLEYLNTRLGRLDVLGAIGNNRSYEDLLPDTHEIDIGGGVRVKVLNLETLITVKEGVGGEKDRAVLPILRATLEEQRKLSS